MTTLVMTAKLNDIDPLAWLADVLARNDHPIHRFGELLPWNWAAEMERREVAALMPPPSPALKIILNDIRPAVLRCVEVPFHITLGDGILGAGQAARRRPAQASPSRPVPSSASVPGSGTLSMLISRR